MPQYEFYEPDRDRITSDATISHYGVKGMKWGVRRTAAQLGRRAKSGAKEFAKYQVGQTDKQKAARAKMKTDAKAAGQKVGKAAKDFAKWNIGQSPSQKAARAKMGEDGKKLEAKINKANSKLSKAYSTKVNSMAADYKKNPMKYEMGVAAVAASVGVAANVGMFVIKNR